MRNSLFLPLIDLLLAPLALVGGVAAAAVARSPSQFPVCRTIFDGLRVHPIRHHYYSPLVYPSDLRVPLDRQRMIDGLDLNAEGQLRLIAEFRYRDKLLAISRDRFDFDNKCSGREMRNISTISSGISSQDASLRSGLDNRR